VVKQRQRRKWEALILVKDGLSTSNMSHLLMSLEKTALPWLTL
jgi:hypothetical protein